MPLLGGFECLSWVASRTSLGWLREPQPPKRGIKPKNLPQLSSRTFMVAEALEATMKVPEILMSEI